jgi:hypothetical protein
MKNEQKTNLTVSFSNAVMRYIALVPVICVSEISSEVNVCRKYSIDIGMSYANCQVIMISTRNIFSNH